MRYSGQFKCRNCIGFHLPILLQLPQERLLVPRLATGVFFCPNSNSSEKFNGSRSQIASTPTAAMPFGIDRMALAIVELAAIRAFPAIFR